MEQVWGTSKTFSTYVAVFPAAVVEENGLWQPADQTVSELFHKYVVIQYPGTTHGLSCSGYLTKKAASHAAWDYPNVVQTNWTPAREQQQAYWICVREDPTHQRAFISAPFRGSAEKGAFYEKQFDRFWQLTENVSVCTSYETAQQAAMARSRKAQVEYINGNGWTVIDSPWVPSEATVEN